MNRAVGFAGRIAVGLVFALIWQLLAGGLVPGFQLIDPIYVSTPSAILLALVRDWGVLMDDSVYTLQAAFGGFALGVILGVLFGILFARFSWLAYVLDPFFLAANALPRPALAPLFVIWFGLGLTSKTLLSLSIVFFLVFYNTYAGIRSLDPKLVQSLRVMGANEGQVMRLIVIPAVTSWIFAALRVGIAYSMFGALVGEFAGATAGLGYRLTVARGLLQTDLLFAILLLLAIVGVLLTEGAKWVEARLLRWRPPQVGF